MIDFVKLSVSGLSPSVLEENPLLDFKCEVSSKTGEINEDRKKAEYHHLKIEIVNDKYINVSGSLHKYCKDENYSDFTKMELTQAIESLKELGINPENCRLQNIEFGVNVKGSWITPELVLKSAINHRGRPFDKLSTKGRDIGKKCDHQQYSIKIYNKGKQYGLDEKILRFEIKVVKMKCLESLGIAYLKDLLNEDKLLLLSSKLADIASFIMFDDLTLTACRIGSPSEWAIVREGRNPRYWEELKRDPKNRSQYDFMRKAFLKIVNNSSKRNLNEEFQKEVKSKFFSLMQ